MTNISLKVGANDRNINIKCHAVNQEVAYLANVGSPTLQPSSSGCSGARLSALVNRSSVAEAMVARSLARGWWWTSRHVARMTCTRVGPTMILGRLWMP